MCAPNVFYYIEDSHAVGIRRVLGMVHRRAPDI